jgi:glycosyltransferase involved in cell wall biosynthesis
MTCKKIIVVLGMHRSGTSALTRGLSTLGVGLGDTLHPAGSDNPTGFWEDRDIIAFNNKLLSSLGSAYDRVGLTDVDFDHPVFDILYEEAKLLLTQKTENVELWGMKDPRLARLLVFWKKLFRDLGIEAAYVIALRNPLNVAESLLRRNSFPPVKSHHLWLEHMVQCVAHSENERRLVVDYDNLLQNPAKELSRVANALSIAEPEKSALAIYVNDFLDPNLRHGQRTEIELRKSNIDPPALADLYTLLTSCAQDKLNINSPVFLECFEALRTSLKRSQPMLEWIAETERNVEALQVQLGEMSGSLHTVNLNTVELTRRLHEANLELISLRAQRDHAIHAVDEKAGTDEADALRLAAENKGLETLVGSLKYESEKAAGAFQALLAQKDEELAELNAKIAGATEAAIRSNYLKAETNATRSDAENLLLRADIAELKTRQAELRFIHGDMALANQTLTARREELELAVHHAQQAETHLHQHVEHLQFELNEARSALAYENAQMAQLKDGVTVLSSTWGAFFSSRAWTVAKILGRKSAMPVITMPNGKPFDEGFYLSANPDVAAAGMVPAIHYLCDGAREGRIAYPEQSKAVHHIEIDLIDVTEPNAVDDASSGGEADELNPETTATPLPGDTDFDAQLYAMLYPDIVEAGLDPEAHYIEHGRAEGRIGNIPTIKLSRSLESLPVAKPTVLFVSHEASRTGAPILSLNIVQQLLERFNVVVLLLGGGVLESALIECGAVIAGPVSLNRSEIIADLTVGNFLKTHSFVFAIVNSIESQITLKPLAQHYVPTVSLIHEFAAYTRPKSTVYNAMLWAGQTVFSATATLESAQAAVPDLNSETLRVLPQGKSIVPAQTNDADWIDAEAARLRRSIRPEGFPDDGIVVLGAGWVQIRKGVDLFIECANKVLNSSIGHKCRFIWVGGNFDPEHDVQYSVYLQDQISRSNIADKFAFIPETQAIEHVYQLSDIMLVSSRLDPLPNVAIDAMTLGLPVLCFDKTTGISDILKRNGLADLCVAPYLDTTIMAERINRIACSAELKAEISKKVRDVAAVEFNMTSYVNELIKLAETQAGDIRQEFTDAATIKQAQVADLNFYNSIERSHDTEDEAIRRYVRSWKVGIQRRKLFPGFEPELYKELNHGNIGIQDPLAHYIRAGKPVGPWSHETVAWRDDRSPEAFTTRTLAFVTVRTAQMAQSLVELFASRTPTVDLVFITDSQSLGFEMRERIGHDHFPLPPVINPQTGSLASMLSELDGFSYQDYSVVGHLNVQPLGESVADNRQHEDYILDNMVGRTYRSLETSLRLLNSKSPEDNYGVIFPDDPEVFHNLTDSQSLTELCRLMGIIAPKYECTLYPARGSFWAESTVISTLLSRSHLWKPALASLRLPAEAQEQILARLISQACLSTGKIVATTAVTGSTY